MGLHEMFGLDRNDPVQVQARELVRADRKYIKDLVRAREEAGLSQTEVAERMGIDPSAVSRFESGRRDPHLSTLRRYALAVGAGVRHEVTRRNHEAEVVEDALVHGPSRQWTWREPSLTGPRRPAVDG